MASKPITITISKLESKAWKVGPGYTWVMIKTLCEDRIRPGCFVGTMSSWPTLSSRQLFTSDGTLFDNTLIVCCSEWGMYNHRTNDIPYYLLVTREMFSKKVSILMPITTALRNLQISF